MNNLKEEIPIGFERQGNLLGRLEDSIFTPGVNYVVFEHGGGGGGGSDGRDPSEILEKLVRSAASGSEIAQTGLDNIREAQLNKNGQLQQLAEEAERATETRTRNIFTS